MMERADPHDRPQQSPRRPEPHRHREDRPQGAFPRRRDAGHDGDHRHAGLDPRDRAVARWPHRLRLGLWRRRVRQARQSGPAHRGDRPAVEVAHARHRSRRRLRAARRDDRCRAAWSGRRASSATRCWRSIPPPTRCRRSTSAPPPIGSRSAMRPARCSFRSSRTTSWSSTSPAARRSTASRSRTWSKGSRSRPTAQRSTSARRPRPSSM